MFAAGVACGALASSNVTYSSTTYFFPAFTSIGLTYVVVFVLFEIAQRKQNKEAEPANANADQMASAISLHVSNVQEYAATVT